MTLVEELRTKKSRDNRELLDRAADRIEELERKQSKGEWVDRYKGKYANSLYVCSICDGKSLLVNHMNELLTPTVKQILTPYCPHCGAKMKGGENNG